MSKRTKVSKKAVDKKRKKALKISVKAINDFFDIESIETNYVQLQNGEVIAGVKVDPFDIWTAKEQDAQQRLNSLRYLFNKVNFTIYQAIVAVTPDMVVAENIILEGYEDKTEKQQAIVYDDLEKIEIFNEYNKDIEFFMMIKAKNEDILQKNMNILKTEIGRVVGYTDLVDSDFYKYLEYMFDIDYRYFSEGTFKGKRIKEAVADYQEEDIEPVKLRDPHFTDFTNLSLIEEFRNYFIINNTHYRLLMFQSTPEKFDAGYLNYIGRNPDKVKVLFFSEPSKVDIGKHLNKAYANLQEDYEKAVKGQEQQRQQQILSELQSIQTYITQINSNKDKTLNCAICLVLKADNKEDLEFETTRLLDTIRLDRASVYVPRHLQLTLFKYFVPFFTKGELLTNNLEFNVGFPIPATDFALLYPYHYSYLDDENGYLYGFEKNMGGRIIFNPFYYIDMQKKATLQTRLSGNIIFIGETGSGKSVDLFLLIKYLYRTNVFQIWIDPENKNKEYTQACGGSYIDFGSEKYMFNMFELTRVSTDTENLTEEELRKEIWNTRRAINEAIENFKNVLSLYVVDIDDATLSSVGEVALRMYHEHKVTINGIEMSLDEVETFDVLKSTDFPTLYNFNDTVTAMIYEEVAKGEVKRNVLVNSYEQLALKIKPMLNEHKDLFAGHTTIGMELKPGNIISFGTKSLFKMSKNVQQALHQIIYFHAFNYCLDPNIKSAFTYDEAHLVLRDNKKIAALVDQFTRRSRKYNNLCVLATQEPSDFMNEDVKAVINNSTYLIVKLLSKENARKALQDIIGLEDDVIDNIKDFEQGDSYFMCGRNIFYMKTFATEKEINEQKGIH